MLRFGRIWHIVYHYQQLGRLLLFPIFFLSVKGENLMLYCVLVCFSPVIVSTFWPLYKTKSLEPSAFERDYYDYIQHSNYLI